jgi:hypothetical protein
MLLSCRCKARKKKAETDAMMETAQSQNGDSILPLKTFAFEAFVHDKERKLTRDRAVRPTELMTASRASSFPQAPPDEAGGRSFFMEDSRCMCWSI